MLTSPSPIHFVACQHAMISALSHHQHQFQTFMLHVIIDTSAFQHQNQPAMFRSQISDHPFLFMSSWIPTCHGTNICMSRSLPYRVTIRCLSCNDRFLNMAPSVPTLKAPNPRTSASFLGRILQSIYGRIHLGTSSSCHHLSLHDII